MVTRPINAHRVSLENVAAATAMAANAANVVKVLSAPTTALGLLLLLKI